MWPIFQIPLKPKQHQIRNRRVNAEIVSRKQGVSVSQTTGVGIISITSEDCATPLRQLSARAWPPPVLARRKNQYRSLQSDQSIP